MLFLFGVFVLWFLFGSAWRYASYSVIGVKHSDEVLIKSHFDKVFRFPNNHKILSRFSVYKRLVNVIPDIESIDVIGSDILKIIVNDKSVFGVICDTDENCYFYDDTGFVFKKSFDYTGSIFLKIISNDSITIGDVIKCADVCLRKDFRDYVLSKNISYIELEKDKMILKDNDNVMFKALPDVDNTLDKLQVFFESVKGSDYGDYVDLRFNSKIFYK